MASEKCGHHTIYGHEILADLFDLINFKKYSFFGKKQVKKRDKGRKRSSTNQNFCINSVKKILPRHKKPSPEQEIWVETLVTSFSYPSFDFIEKLATEKPK